MFLIVVIFLRNNVYGYTACFKNLIFWFQVLLFDRELRISYDISDYLLKTQGPLTVLASADCIRKWLNVERTCKCK